MGRPSHAPGLCTPWYHGCSEGFAGPDCHRIGGVLYLAWASRPGLLLGQTDGDKQRVSFRWPFVSQAELEGRWSRVKARPASADQAAGDLATAPDPGADADAGAGTKPAPGGCGSAEGGGGSEVPPLHEITSFFSDLYHRTKLKFVCVVLSLIYVERLMKVGSGVIRMQCQRSESRCADVFERWSGGAVWHVGGECWGGGCWLALGCCERRA